MTEQESERVSPAAEAEITVTPSVPESKRPPRKWLAFVREVLLVFLGVWGALAADAWRDRREQVRRTTRIVRAIQADIHDITRWYDKWRPSVGSGLEAWERERRAGKHVAPYYVRIPGAEHAALVSWQVALASSALDVLDPELVFEIGHVSNEWNGVGERFARYMALTETTILPKLAAGPDAFYGQTGELRPEFTANVTLLREVLAEMDQKVTWLKTLESRLTPVLVK